MAGEKQDHMKIPKLQNNYKLPIQMSTLTKVYICKSEGSAITFYLNTEARSKQDKSSVFIF